MRNFAEVKSRQVPSRKEISGWRVCPILLLPDPGHPPAEDTLSTAVGFALPSARDPLGVADGATASPRRRRLQPAGGGPAQPGQSPPPRREVGSAGAPTSEGCGPFLEVLQRLGAVPPDTAKLASTS